VFVDPRPTSQFRPLQGCLSLNDRLLIVVSFQWSGKLADLKALQTPAHPSNQL
jgi:hypothetical protein